MHRIKSNPNSIAPKTLPAFEFSIGPIPRTKTEKTPMKVFQLFMTLSVLGTIVTQTNAYAQEKGVTLSLHVEELQAFIAMNVAMGMLRLPQIRDYWATNDILSTPWFPAIMSRDRFFQLLRYLHLVDSSLQHKKGEEGYDPLFKVRPLIDHLSAVFPHYYQLGRHLLVDEMMIGTRCHVSFLQYLPKKPTKFGIKVFVNSEAKTGYVLSFQVYTGKDTTKKGSNLVSYKVVMELLELYLGKGHRVFTDNYYSSPKLFADLFKKNTYATGTVRQSRKQFPETLKGQHNKLDVGQYRFARCGQMTIVLWHDRRDVHVLSTAHNRSVGTAMKRPKGSREKVPVACPTCIVDYNSFMGGVDLTDQYLSYYSLTNRSGGRSYFGDLLTYVF